MMIKRHGFTVVELLVVILIFLMMFGALMPFVRIARRRVNKAACVHNLRQISLALHGYAVEHKNAFPPTLGSLYPEYIKDEKTLDCPATRHKGTVDNPNYDYVPGLTEVSPPKDVIVRDHDGNHKRSGKNVLRVDGSIDWIANSKE